MKVIRFNAFETNSSSCHDLVLSKLDKFNINKNHIEFNCLQCYPDAVLSTDTELLANVLYTLIYEYMAFHRLPIIDIIESKITEVLNKYGVTCSFSAMIDDFDPDYGYSTILSSSFIDEVIESIIEIEVPMSLRFNEMKIGINENRLMNFIFGDTYFDYYDDSYRLPEELDRFPWRSENHEFYEDRI